MEEIKKKIQELLEMSNTPTNYNSEVNAPDGIVGKMRRQDALQTELIALARANNTLLGRMVRFPHADSYALYVVTKINKKTVQITWVDYCDAWVDDRAGYLASISIVYVKDKCDFDDRWQAMADAKRAENAKAGK